MSDNIQCSGSGGPPEGRGTTGQLFYPLNDGAIDHWLMAGPHARPLDVQGPYAGTGLGDDPFAQKGQLAAILRRARAENSMPAYSHPTAADSSSPDESALSDGWRSGLPAAPAERDRLAIGDSKLTWRAYRCLDDHLIDIGGLYSTWHYVQAWAYAELVCPAAQRVRFVANLCGAAEIWLNGQRLLQEEQRQRAQLIPVDARLQAGHNRILARLDAVARGDSPQRFGLSIAGRPGEGWSVRLSSRIEPLERRRKFERFFEDAWLDRYLYTAQDNVEIYWPDEFERPESSSSFKVPDAPARRSGGASDSDIELRLQTPTGRIYMMARSPFPGNEGSAAVDMGTARRAPEGACELLLMPGPEEYSVGGMRVQRKLRLHVSKNPFSERPAEPGGYPQRRLEALLEATRRQGDLFCEIARMALERWPQVRVAAIQESIAALGRGAADSGCSVVGLLGMLARFGGNGSFPAKLKKTLEEQLCEFPFWPEGERDKETGRWGESRQILYFAAQILAGQLFPGNRFAGGRSGRWQREEGERGAIAWCQKRGQYGFREWDSSRMVEANVVALVHLVDLAENDEARELAAVVLDRIFFSMALNSYRGAYGSTQGAADTLSIRSARIAPSSGISRLLWGMGVFNEHLMGSVSLACSDIYFLPPIIGAIAAEQPEAMLNRERHCAAPRAEGAQEAVSWEVNKVTYKTADGMLCSAQDYRPGQPGTEEHIWQATLGPDAVVFVNQPACLSEDGAHRPNCWRGNATLPRVAQWRDALIAVHNFPDGEGVGDLTHAHFPLHAFDEYSLQEGWAFARKGDGYLALTAARGLTLTERGEQAYRELRSCGRENIWVCHLGRRAEDGDFADFRRGVLASGVEFSGLSVDFTTLRQQRLEFGWTGALRVNGKEEAISGFRQFENPYCAVDAGASQMELLHGEDALRLHFV